MSRALNKDRWDANGINTAGTKSLSELWKISYDDAYNKLMSWLIHNPNPNDTTKDRREKTDAERQYGRQSDQVF